MCVIDIQQQHPPHPLPGASTTDRASASEYRSRQYPLTALMDSIKKKVRKIVAAPSTYLHSSASHHTVSWCAVLHTTMLVYDLSRGATQQHTEMVRTSFVLSPIVLVTPPPSCTAAIHIGRVQHVVVPELWLTPRCIMH